jgi:hypothetical protein
VKRGLAERYGISMSPAHPSELRAPWIPVTWVSHRYSLRVDNAAAFVQARGHF